MEIKSTYDMRGRQRNVLRLLHFDREGLAHIIAYRILVSLCIITGIVAIYSLLSGSIFFLGLTKALFAIVWLLFGIELYSVYKAFGIISTKGVVFGRLNESFVNSEIKKSNWQGLVKAGAPMLLVVWYALFVAFAVVVLL